LTPKPPKPFNVSFQALIEFDWICPHCRQRNQSRRDFRTEYLTAKCGVCHFWTPFDYHRSSDAPPAARALDGVNLGPARAERSAVRIPKVAVPGIHRKFAQKQRRQHAGDTLK
jgi:hypothetical protein